MKQLSNKERKYRNKIIAENHFKKDMQRYLDFWVAENRIHSINLTYKYIYFNYGLLHSFLVKYNLGKLSKAMKDVGCAAKEVGNTLSNALKVFNEFSAIH